MSKAKYQILQIGQTNWANELTIPAELDWNFCHPYQLAEVLDQYHAKQVAYQKALKEAIAKKDDKFNVKPPAPLRMLVFSAVENISGITQLRKYVDAYALVYDQKISHIPHELSQVFHDKFAWQRDFSDKQALVQKLSEALYMNQSGLLYDVTALDINPNFKGKVTYHGTYGLELEGDFGDEFTPVVAWRKSLYNDPGRTSELWLEYEKEDTVKLQFNVRESTGGSIDFKNTYTFSEEEMKHPVRVGELDGATFISPNIALRGHGKIIIGGFHSRWSRRGFGTLIIGGQRAATKKRKEFFHYFDPGDMKPPLNVYFAGYRTKQGFEAFTTFKRMNAPFLLFADPRFEGSGFYIGDEEYEQKIQKVILDALNWLNFTPKEMTMSGISAGTYGALYYSALFKPRAVLGIKPIVNLDLIAKNGHLVRPDNDFATIFDIVKANGKGTDAAALTRVHDHFWDVFNQADLAGVDYYFGHMYEDDYDNQTYGNLTQALAKKHARLVGKGAHGHHTDGSDVLLPWMFNQLKAVLQNDFKRGGSKDE